MRIVHLSSFAIVVSILSATIGALLAADVYYLQPIADLKIVDGKLSDTEVGSIQRNRFWRSRQVMQPYAVLDGQGEAYVTAADRRFASSVPNAAAVTRGPSVAIRTAKARKITGQLFLPKKDFSGMVALKFSIPADRGNAGNRKAFLQCKLQHYQSLMSRNIPGTAWFRHPVRVTRKDLGIESVQAGPQRGRVVRPRGG